ncbi:MAG: hypothetical protein ABW133_04130 [Polyangiaceae bacterium]
MDATFDLFAHGPPIGIERVLRLRGPRGVRVVRRAVAVAAIGWGVPFLLLVARAIFIEGDALRSFVADFAVHARSLVAAPILVFAESICAPRLGAVACHFLHAGLVPDSERARFDAAMKSTARLLDVPFAEIGVAVFAYLTVVAMIASDPPMPAWQVASLTASSRFSLAGWWHALVSVPLLLVLVFGWLWRVALWARFLWLVAKIELRLIPAHPDLAAGLKFVGHSLRAFSIVGFALGTIVAGTLANRVSGGAPVLVCKDAAIGLTVVVAVLFGAPLLVFTHRLLAAWRRGILEYSALADRLGRAFETRWITEEKGRPMLEAPDFSAAIDLYSVVGNAYRMKIVPVDYESLAALIVATLAPIGPVLLLRFPIEVILDELAKLAF